MLDGKSKITGLKGKSMMNTGTGKDVTKIKMKDSGANMPASNSKPQSLKARNKK